MAHRTTGKITTSYIKHITQEDFGSGVLVWLPSISPETDDPIHVYEDTEIIMPMGFWSNPKLGIYPQMTINRDATLSDHSIEQLNPINLRDYQVSPFFCIQKTIENKIKHQRPCFIRLIMPCGFGKTIMALKIIQTFKIKSVIVVWCSSLYSQWEKAISLSGIHAYYIGDSGIVDSILQIKKNVPDVIVVPYRHVMRRDFCNLIHKKYGALFVDESHKHNLNHYNKFKRFLHLYPIYMTYFLTATPRLFNSFYCGHDLVFIRETPLNKTLIIRKRTFKNTDHEMVQKLKNMKQDKYKNGLGNIIEEDCYRKEFVLTSVLDVSQTSDNNILLITKSRNLMNWFYSNLQTREANVFIADAKSSETRKTLDQLENHTTPFILVSTLQYVGTGFDLCNLGTIIFSCVSITATDFIQSVGRVSRVNPKIEHRLAYVFNATSLYSLKTFVGRKIYSIKQIGTTHGWNIIEEDAA